jgi:Tol biopolymer transport system component
MSPDGKRIAFGSDDGYEASIWIYELSGTSFSRPSGGPARCLTAA